MKPDRGRDLATMGLAIGAPVALLSGIAVGVTLVGGPPAFLVIVFTAAVGLVVTSLLFLTMQSARRPDERE